MRIGFPLDSGDRPAVIFVKLLRARMHSCKDGGTSGLRENSGANYVLERADTYIRDNYRFQFEIVPRPNNVETCTPRNICDIGYSDAAACALAIASYDSIPNENDAPIVLVSCCLAYGEKANGLKDLRLEKVTNEDPAIARESLFDKWRGACEARATALVLHESDAELLRQELEARKENVERYSLTTRIFFELAKSPHDKIPIVACKTEQFSILKKALQSGRKQPPIAACFFLMLAVAMGIWAFIANSDRYENPQLLKEMENIANATMKNPANAIPGQLYIQGGIDIQEGRTLQVEIIHEKPAHIEASNGRFDLVFPMSLELRVDRPAFPKHGETKFEMTSRLSWKIRVIRLWKCDAIARPFEWDSRNDEVTIKAKDIPIPLATIRVRNYAEKEIRQILETLGAALFAKTVDYRQKVLCWIYIAWTLALVSLLTGIVLL